MFLNLSNHPSSHWSSDQLTAALFISGPIEDMEFPNVPPDADGDVLDELAEETAKKVLSRRPTVVHLMGELTLCHRLVNLLKNSGVNVVASTSKRDVVMEGGDVKRAKFRFVRFRTY